MEVNINGTVFRLPASPDELLLGDWISFVQKYGQDLDARADEIQALGGWRRELAIAGHRTESAFSVLAHFTRAELETAKKIYPVPVVLRLYRDVFSGSFNVPETEDLAIPWRGKTYLLQEAPLSQASTMTFGEVVDSKAMQQNAGELNWTRWELILHICAIFLRPEGEEYSEELAYIGGDRAQLFRRLPIRAAILVSRWFEDLNDQLETAFTVFQDSSIKSGQFMKKHFAAWGWVNFLKQIAKTKVFDIPGNGLHSIECARRAKAFDVLMYASEEKEFGEALHADMDAERRKK